MKEFREFLEKGIIRKQSPNNPRARDLVQESERKEKSLKQILDKIGLTNDNANDIIEYGYDILISLIRSKLYEKGYKSGGEGAHEAEVSFMKELGFSDIETKFMDELRYFRNGIKYYGKRFDENYAKKVLEFMAKAIKKLK